jgi:NAD(P)-dependent dehydrogenase (short-subunit alcohol dehydrogenase family)
MARTLAAEGVPIVIADVIAEAAEMAAAGLVARGASAVAVGNDITPEADIEAMVARCVGEFGAST